MYFSNEESLAAVRQKITALKTIFMTYKIICIHGDVKPIKFQLLVQRALIFVLHFCSDQILW